MDKNQFCYLTTVDNPYDKIEDYDQWLGFDIEMGYYSDAYLDRIAKISPAMSEIEKEREYERAIDEIIKYDFRNIYVKKYGNKDEEIINDDPSQSLDDILNEMVWGGIR